MKLPKISVFYHPEENWISDRLVRELEVLDKKKDFNPLTNSIVELEKRGTPQSKASEFIKCIWFPQPWIIPTTGVELDDGTVMDIFNQMPNVLRECRIVVTIHHIVPEKFILPERLKNFRKLDKVVNLYHVTNELTKEVLQRFTSKEIQVVPFWTNPQLFYPLGDAEKKEARKYLKIPEDKFVIGSFQRDTEPSGKPKLEKGPDILCDILEKDFDLKNTVLLLTGRENRRRYIINRLETNAPDLNIISYEDVPLEYMNGFYNCLDLYIVSSRVEGGPQAIVEAGLSKTPIVSTDVGIASKILAPESIYKDQEGFRLAKPNIEVAYENAMSMAINQEVIENFKKMLLGA